MLPKKRISAGILLFDEQKRLLVVEPVYKETWEIPGGVVEANESPRQAVQRELQEELGLTVEVQRLLAVDYTAETAERTESLHFVFLGPTLTKELIEAIRLPAEELRSYRFLSPKKAVKLLNKKLRRRVRRCLGIVNGKKLLYLEDQKVK